VLAASAPFLIVFALHLRRLAERTARPAGRASIWPRLLVAGGVIEGAALVTSACFHLALVGVSPIAMYRVTCCQGRRTADELRPDP
jgi:hypothetical protein